MLFRSQVGAAGVPEVHIGMAHRGRLASIMHTVGRPPESILAEFEGQVEHVDDGEDHADGEPYADAGDVKYHLGAEGTFKSRAGRSVHVQLAANPSHLEQVNAVTEGGVRATQTIRANPIAEHDADRAVALLIHGDAAFPGQGVVAETLNLQGLVGYSTGGTIHIIVNNQVGFTTDSKDSYAGAYCTNIAKSADAPILHVNGGDAEACAFAGRLAMEWRTAFGEDSFVDMWCWRKNGHNETNEPNFTQPLMYRRVRAAQPVVQRYAAQLLAEGTIDAGTVDRKSTRLNSSHEWISRMPSSA